MQTIVHRMCYRRKTAVPFVSRCAAPGGALRRATCFAPHFWSTLRGLFHDVQVRARVLRSCYFTDVGCVGQNGMQRFDV